jgi:hypothetical protein
MHATDPVVRRSYENTRSEKLGSHCVCGRAAASNVRPNTDFIKSRQDFPALPRPTPRVPNISVNRHPNLLLNTEFLASRSTLAPPRSLSVGTATVSSVLLAWKSPLTVNGKKVTDYPVEYRVAGDPSWSTFAHTASTKTSGTISGLSAGTSYEFRAAARTARGDSAVTSTVVRNTRA